MVSEFIALWFDYKLKAGQADVATSHSELGAHLCVLNRHLWTEPILRQTKHEWNKEGRAQKLHEDVKGRGFLSKEANEDTSEEGLAQK